MNKKAIKNKIKSTTSIKKITRTMEMVSVAKMKKSLNLADGYKAFGLEAKKILEILASQREKSVFALHNDSKLTLVIIVAGQKGLCGGYNSNIYRKISREYKDEIAMSNLRFICIGKYAEKIAKKFDNKEKGQQSNIVLSFLGKDFESTQARVMTKSIAEDFKSAMYKSIDLVYTDFENVNSQLVQKETLLPFIIKSPSVEVKQKVLDYTFEPNISDVYEKTVKVLLQNIISGSVLRARAAEHAARMMAMKTATDNASEMISELKLWYNKARQAAITQEIAEISSAAIAMQAK